PCCSCSCFRALVAKRLRSYAKRSEYAAIVHDRKFATGCVVRNHKSRLPPTDCLDRRCHPCACIVDCSGNVVHQRPSILRGADEQVDRLSIDREALVAASLEIDGEIRGCYTLHGERRSPCRLFDRSVKS